MAAEQQLAIVKPFNMANELCIWLKTVNAGDYKHIRKECPCVRIQRGLRQRKFDILKGLGQRKFESLNGSETPTGELISYLTICLLRYLLRFISASIFIKYNRFPYNADTVNHWFTLEKNEQRDQAVNIINVDEVGRKSKCYTTEKLAENGFSCSLEHDTFELFFHGTNHTSARNIIENGIDLLKGGKDKDYSNGDGFYVSKSFEKALDWSSRRYRRDRPRRLAVLVFRVSNNELRGNNNENGLDLRDLRDPVTRTAWENVVKQFRCGEPCLDFIIDVMNDTSLLKGQWLPHQALNRKRTVTSCVLEK